MTIGELLDMTPAELVRKLPRNFWAHLCRILACVLMLASVVVDENPPLWVTALFLAVMAPLFRGEQ